MRRLSLGARLHLAVQSSATQGGGTIVRLITMGVMYRFATRVIESLGQRAAETLDRLGYTNVSVRIGDGYQGWPEHAPFDAILVTAAPDEVPEPLVQQLRTGGRMVIPVGPQGDIQSLQVLEKTGPGETDITDVLPVRFVPFLRDDQD